MTIPLWVLSPVGNYKAEGDLKYLRSSHDLDRPESQRFGVKLTDLDISKKDLMKTFVGQF
jgi:hypothetical protein